MHHSDYYIHHFLNVIFAIFTLYYHAETKLGEYFPTSQFLVDRLSEPFRLDRNRSGGESYVKVWQMVSIGIKNLKESRGF